MNRRAALAIAFIGLNLMACCCGGAGRPQIPPQQVQAKPEPVPLTADEIIARFGEPNSDETNDGTRILRYSGEAIMVKAVCEPGRPTAFFHDKTGDPLPTTNAIDRLAARETIKAIEAKEASRQAEAAKRAKEAEERRKRLAEAAEANKPIVTRENYNKLIDGISLSDAQSILGPAKEVSRAGGIQLVSWERREFLRHVIITATFENGQLKAKAIVGD